MDDPRIKSIQNQIAEDQNVVGTKYAFKGFGRSTEAAEKITEEAQKGQALLSGALQLFSALDSYNQLLQQGASDKTLANAAETLSYAQKYFDKLKNETAGRRTKNLEDLQSYSQTLGNTPSDKVSVGSRKSSSKRISLNANIREIKPKNLDKVKASGAKNRRVPLLSKIPNLTK